MQRTIEESEYMHTCIYTEVHTHVTEEIYIENRQGL